MALKTIFVLAALPLAAQAETILGAYIFHRHGDRTAKVTPPVDLTVLGASQVYESGTYYRSRYVSSASDSRILGLAADGAVHGQLSFASPEDPVLQNSAQIFFQGLYPPLGATSGAETLANGTEVASPMGGRQFVSVTSLDDTAASSHHSESRHLLQSGSGCGAAIKSTLSYFQSDLYKQQYSQSSDFYKEILPAVEPHFDDVSSNYFNAYTIWDYINVNRIHNDSFLDADLVSDSQLAILKFLANVHEWNLAYNASDPVRAVAGSMLAGHVLDALEPLVRGDGSAPKLHVQFGAYATFLAFFGLADLPAADSLRFQQIVDYAASIVFELYRDNLGDVRLRFFFANGEPGRVGMRQVALFGRGSLDLPWAEFEASMSRFAVRDRETWCDLCGESTGVCAGIGASSSPDAKSSSKDSGGVSAVVAGVIGALVALFITLAILGLGYFFGGMKLVKKSTLKNMVSVDKLDDA